MRGSGTTSGAPLPWDGSAPPAKVVPTLEPGQASEPQ